VTVYCVAAFDSAARRTVMGEIPFPKRHVWSGENPFPWRRVERCSYANVRQLKAIHVQGRLFIRALGDAPNPCYRVSISRSPIDVHPPEFEVRQCIDDGKICIQVITPFDVVGMFAAVPVDHITVKTATGTERVEVQIVNDSAGLPADGASDAYATLRLGKVWEGLIESMPAQPREATGYSDAYSFDEAFADAVRNLPPAEKPFPDQLTTIVVAAIGAEIGGIVGLNRMFVRVKAT
jgi:hypothetical protein